jgi:hypothetical protein
MTLPTKGAWARRYAQPYSGASVWGTGIHPIHASYGGPPVRMGALHGRQGDEITVPAHAVPQELIPAYMWGYTIEDTSAAAIFYDDRPSWNVPPEDSPVRYSTQGQPAYNAPGAVRAMFRSMRGGAHRIYQDFFINPPTETVSEGWINKPKGEAADAKPSDPAQYEMQTSMTQRYAVRTNALSLERGTDEPREPINSRVVGQKLKVYSEGERHYDMFPRQQKDFEREFWYRTAGTGIPEQMLPNEMWSISPVERTPPPDPYIGTEDTSHEFDYGYTAEDNFYA